jgi:type II secretion system protein J
MKTTRHNRANAFTLMELVLAVGVCALVMAAISGVFFSAVRVREATARAVDEALPAQQALAFLRRDLQGAMPPTTNGVLVGGFRAGDVTSAGMDETVAIEFYTTTGTLHAHEPWGDVQRVAYYLRDTGHGKELVRAVTRNLLTTLPPAADQQWMMGDVQSVQFDCFDGTQWRAAWDTTLADTNLPAAVRVRITRAGADPRDPQPIELFVPVNSQISTNQPEANEG